MGPYYEMRIYTLANGAQFPKLQALWEKGLPERAKISPLCAAWHSELGVLNQFIHIWPYKSVDERNATRDKAKATGMWPPSAARQEDRPARLRNHQAGKQDPDAVGVFAPPVNAQRYLHPPLPVLAPISRVRNAQRVLPL